MRIHVQVTAATATPGRTKGYFRLVEIKKKYDPKNVLRLNQNIKPDKPSNN